MHCSVTVTKYKNSRSLPIHFTYTPIIPLFDLQTSVSQLQSDQYFQVVFVKVCLSAKQKFQILAYKDTEKKQLKKQLTIFFQFIIQYDSTEHRLVGDPNYVLKPTQNFSNKLLWIFKDCTFYRALCWTTDQLYCCQDHHNTSSFNACIMVLSVSSFAPHSHLHYHAGDNLWYTHHDFCVRPEQGLKTGPIARVLLPLFLLEMLCNNINSKHLRTANWDMGVHFHMWIFHIFCEGLIDCKDTFHVVL